MTSTVKEFNAYLESNYSDLLQVANTIVKGDGRELLHDVICDLLQSKLPADILKRGTGKQAEIRRYVIASLRMSYHSSSSRYHKRHRKHLIQRNQNLDLIVEEIYSSHDKKLIELQINFLREKLQQIPEFERLVCVLWYNGHQLKDIHAATGISKGTLSKALNFARKHLKDEVKRSWGHYREDHEGNRNPLGY